MTELTYCGVPAHQVLKRISACAWRLRVPTSHRPDAQQEVLRVLEKLEYDPARAHGATPMTFLTTVINRQLRSYLRGLRRSCHGVDPQVDLEATLAAADQPHAPPVPACLVAPEEPTDLAIDVADAIAALPQREQAVCRGLAAGKNVSELAGELACGRDTIMRSIRRIHAAFATRGLQGWIHAE